MLGLAITVIRTLGLLSLHLRLLQLAAPLLEHYRRRGTALGRRIAEESGPSAELVVVPGAGHGVDLTRAAVVDRALLDLLNGCRTGSGRPADSPAARARGNVIADT